ncbi:hypothetical protein AB0O67_21845 [Streptomyces sp. NPDC086077]|uniref:hypothetical protein n=1 Tax=Streptomyces sp. NPDC086077 TaxID=3154862 RepID=UPI003441222E
MSPGPERPPAVVVLADDPVPREAVTGYLRSRPQMVEALGFEDRARADVMGVLATDVTSQTLASIREASLETGHPDMRVVLVADSITEAQLTGAISHRAASSSW